MPGRPRDDEEIARLRGKRVALGLVGAVATWFMVASVEQITPAALGLAVTPLALGPPGSPERGCAIGLRSLEDQEPFSAAQREATYQSCRGASHGLDAWAALERLRIAREQLKTRDPAVLAPMLHDLAAHLPSDLR